MDYMAGEVAGENYVLKGARHFDLAATLDCGQAFRWEQVEEDAFRGIALGRLLEIRRKGEDVILYGVGGEEFHTRWKLYFDLDRDYGKLKRSLRRDPVLRQAVDFAPGIRVLRQNGWEALCSFIMSQNNNIARNKGMIDRLCRLAGEEIPGGYAFPTPERLAGLTVEDLAPARCGFRAKYILDAAKALCEKRVCLNQAARLPLPEAREMLMRIYGVGPKVADCALLYGLGRVDCVPMDVWMKRVMERWFPDGLPEWAEKTGGIAQQYLFHYARMQGLK